MDARILLAIVSLQLLQVAAGAAQSRASDVCAVPGALHEEPSGTVHACVTRTHGQHAWTSFAPSAARVVATPRAAPDCTDSTGQFKCDTECKNSGVCLSGNQWIQLQACTDNQKCLNGVCEDIIQGDDGEDDCTAQVDTVRCLHSGKYPNLLDCSSYYVCTTQNGIGPGQRAWCDEGTLYDACFQDCGIKTDDTCSWVDDSACVVGEYGVAPNNDRLYYICTLNSEGKPYPLWMKCPSGHFNLVSQMCDREDEAGCGNC